METSENPTPGNDRDDRLKFVLRATLHDAPAPDKDFLARLREQSAAEFSASAQASTSVKGPKGIVMYLRMFGAIAATAAAMAFLVLTSDRNPIPTGEKEKRSQPALAKVLEDTVASRTLQYKVTAGEKTREIVLERGGRWREDLGDGTVNISDGEITWRIGKDGKAAPVNLSIPRNLLVVVLAGIKFDQPDLTKQQPIATEKKGNADYLAYRFGIPTGAGEIKVEALVSADSKKLHSLIAKSGDKIVGELQVTAVEADLPEDKFLVLNSLSEDGRVGKVSDVQGVVSVRPLGQTRSTPLANGLVVMPGDWLRTDNRGANAAALNLISRTKLIVGPGSSLELTKSTQAKLSDGELEVSVPKGSTFELLGPGDQHVVVKDTQHYFLDQNQKLRLATKEPLWLKGFKGATANESIGSLIAKVDGRDTALSVGYHTVTVDIRDQIARTTIEESFVNHTKETLEGVFHFPLPGDASISEFGMWIGNQLIMADVVEKQRAREIFEEMMREKRDPGLLEWAGGNVFKARVWPILPGSEKRIKISYTQVLPLKGNRYTYSYALQSEMLRQNPLRELNLTVNVSSAIPLKRVWSPTHSTRDQATRTSARVEFQAQDYTPRKDFEVVVEQHQRPADVVLIPHRRGDDGYFLLQVMPPASPEDRAVLPDAGPIRLLILADTSASMDRHQRQQQEAFIGALVSSLTPRDSFNLACCDVACDWAFVKPVAADAKNLNSAREMLQKRVSLGWTDLDRAFGSAIGEADANTHVVYVGDGIPTTTTSDPVASAKRLKALFANHGSVGTFHAVTTGPSYEAAATKAIASLGGGSWRRITSEQGPTATALELLREIAKPTLRNVAVEFKGLRTARVYPEVLPNIPAGTQQILLGRYLPEGRDQQGEVVVSGTLNGKPVRMSTKVSLKDAEQGNSFIPRLWARMHLDALLELGASDAIKDEIIALSEEFNIMTPYTSFLVLETDADRARFAVKKRFRMRDGEKFFAEGRDRVDYALLQQQMKRAGTWRLNLRNNVLRSFAGLGRDKNSLQDPRFMVPTRAGNYGYYSFGLRPAGLGGYGFGGGFGGGGFDGDNSYGLGLGGSGFGGGIAGGGIGGGGFGGGGTFVGNELLGDVGGINVGRPLDINMDRPAMTTPALPSSSEGVFGRRREEYSLDALNDTEKEGASAKRKSDIDESIRDEREFGVEGDRVLPVSGSGSDGFRRQPVHPVADLVVPFEPSKTAPGSFMMGTGILSDSGLSGEMILDGQILQGMEGKFGNKSPYNQFGYQNDISAYWRQSWWAELLPPLPRVRKPAPPTPSRWPAEAHKLAESLLRRDKLQLLTGGVELRQVAQSFDPRYSELTSEMGGLELYSPKSWLTRWQGDREQTILNWCDGKERGLIHQAFGVGRIRPSDANDLTLNLSLSDYSLTALDQYFPEFTPTIETLANDRTRLTLKLDRTEIRFLIDSARHVVVEVEYRNWDKIQSTTKFDDFVEVAGSWWARKVESLDDKGKRTGLTTLTIKSLSAEELAGRIKEELAGRDQILFVKAPLPRLSAARIAVAAGKASLEDRIVLLQHFAAIQQATKVREQLDAIEKLTDKPAKRWFDAAVLQLTRRFDELRLRFLDEAGKIASSKLPVNDRYFLARHILTRSTEFMQAAELLPLLDKLAPIYKAQPSRLHAMKELAHYRYYQMSGLNRPDEALAILKQLATDYPRDVSLQMEYAQNLLNLGDTPGALAWIERARAANPLWDESEDEMLRLVAVNVFFQQGRVDDVLKYVEAWMSKEPGTVSPYAVYLAALYRLDQEEKANSTISRWLKEGQVHGEIPKPTVSRLMAAISQAIGQGFGISNYQIEERWRAPLIAVVRFFVDDERNFEIAHRVMLALHRDEYADAVQAFSQEMAAHLLAKAATLSPAQIDRIVGWFSGANLEEGHWKKLTTVLRDRWQAEKDLHAKDALARSLITIMQAHVPADDLLDFLRLQLKEGDPKRRAVYTRQLFDTLLAQGWKAAYEDEAFALLPVLSEGVEGALATRIRVMALYELSDRMIAARAQALNAKIDRPDKLTRTELREKQTANLKTARTEFSDRLATEQAHAPKDLTPWVKMEWMYLDTLLGRNQPQVVSECWAILGAEPPKPIDPDSEIKPEELLALHLQDRAFATLNYIATRPKADSALIDRLLKYIDRGIAQEGDRNLWKNAKRQLLVGLDRPKELEADLRKWLAASPEPNVWRLNLGFLLAEVGRLKESVELFEKIDADKELGPLAYRSLADWYMVLNQKEKHEKALLEQYQFTEESQLVQSINNRLYGPPRGNSPSELDKEVLRIFTVLFQKSAYPANYVYLLQAFYQSTRDFRLLAVLADAVVGQTPVKIYPYLTNMSGIFNLIQDEAVVDQMAEHLAQVRQRAKTAVDKRALDLIEVLVYRRAAELKNQPGPYGDKALAAMKRAFDREWADGEQFLMASMLHSLSAITYKPLGVEQLRELKWLYEQQKKTAFERLRAGFFYASILSQNEGRQAEAIDVLNQEVAEYIAAHDGVLPANGQETALALVQFMQQIMHHAQAEAFLLQRLKKPANAIQEFWLIQQLDSLYQDALARDGEVSLGKGAALYTALERKLRSDTAQENPQHQFQIVRIAGEVYTTAKEKQFPSWRQDLLSYANDVLPRFLRPQADQYRSIVLDMANVIHSLAGPVEAIEFVLNRIEKEPAWLRLNNQDGWTQHSGQLAEWRSQAKSLGAQEPRLLKLLLRELRRDLETQRGSNRLIFHRGNAYYWTEKEPEFVKVAEDVYQHMQGSRAAVVYIAGYFWDGLAYKQRAVEILIAANQRKLLDESAQGILVDYLRELNRFREAIALLEPLVVEHPDNWNYRIRLMNCYFHVHQPDKLRKLLKETDAYFHADNRWHEGAAASLGASTLENELWTESVAYYAEAITLHQRSAPNRGIGDGSLAEYYANQARAFSRLGKPLEAVDAASAAVVAWSPAHAQRANYLERFKEVVSETKNLDDLAAQINAREKQTGAGSPLIHKALAKAFEKRQQYQKAIAQYRAAIELQPEDSETHEALVQCLDKTGDKEGAAAALVEAVDLSRRELKLYKQLGERYQALQRVGEAERAYTSLVEMQPNEAESHSMLAEIRERQLRWDEAIGEWEQAASLRSLEPIALINLAKAQMHQKLWDKADATLNKLERTSWPARFDAQRPLIRNLRAEWVNRNK
jgi:tetratricopeptide (TPR) repeat protein